MTSADSRPVAERHPALIRALHWGTVLIIAGAVAAILYRETTEERALRQVLLELHRQLGLLVLLGLVVRVVARSILGLTNHAPYLTARERVATTLAHGLMYAVIACVTLIGWALCNAHAIRLRLLGILPLPHLVRADSDLADSLSDYHVWAAWTLLAVVVLHVMAALWHHYIRRDGVLTAMLPGKTVSRGDSAPMASRASSRSPGGLDADTTTGRTANDGRSAACR
jgi:cytochrome b561